MSGSGDNSIQMDLVAKVNNVLSSLDQIGGRVEQLTKRTGEHNRMLNKFQQEGSNAFRTVHGHAGSLSEKMRELAHALSVTGGEIGHVAHGLGRFSRFTADMEGGMFKVAAVALIAGVALKAYDAAMERNLENVKKEGELQDQLAERIEKANKEREKSATSGMSQEKAIRELVRRGGPEAREDANRFAKDNGIPLEEAQKGLAWGLRLPSGKSRNTAIAAGLEGRAAGLDFDKTMELIAKSPSLRAQTNEFGNYRNIAASALQKENTGHFGGASVEDLDRAKAGIASDRYLQGARRTTTVQDKNKEHQAEGVASGEAEGAARGELAAALDPLSKLNAEANRKFDIMIKHMEDQAKAQGAFNAAMSDFFAAFGLHPDSIENQRERLQRQKGDVELAAEH